MYIHLFVILYVDTGKTAGHKMDKESTLKEFNYSENSGREETK